MGGERERDRQTDRQTDRVLTAVPSPDPEVEQWIHSAQVYLPPVVIVVNCSVDTVSTAVGPVRVAVRRETSGVAGTGG